MLFRAKKVAQGMVIEFIGRNKQDVDHFSYEPVSSVTKLCRFRSI